MDTYETWSWLRTGDLKNEIEGFFLVAQYKTLRTNAVKAKIDQSTDDNRFRLKEKQETVDYLVRASITIALTNYWQRHKKWP